MKYGFSENLYGHVRDTIFDWLHASPRSTVEELATKILEICSSEMVEPEHAKTGGTEKEMKGKICKLSQRLGMLCIHGEHCACDDLSKNFLSKLN